MSRWTQMLRKVFSALPPVRKASRRKTRRPKATAKPILESFEDRIVPSAANMVSQMAEQEGQVMVAVRQELTTIVAFLEQKVDQAETYLIQQVDRFLGIPTDSGTSSGSSSGGLGIAQENNPPTGISKIRPLSGYNPATVQFGSGPYNVAEQTPDCNPTTITLPVFVTNLPPNTSVSVNYATQDGTAIAGTDYTAQSGTLYFAPGQTSPDYITIGILDDGTDETIGSDVFNVALSNPVNATLGQPNVVPVNIEEGPQQGATDTLVWNPCKNNDAKEPTNWYDQTLGMQLQEGAPGPGPSDPIIFDGTPNSKTSQNAAIDWTKAVTVASIAIQNGYNAQQTIESGLKLESKGTGGTALSMDGTSKLALTFNSATADSIFRIDNNTTITNMELKGGSLATLQIYGGTTTIAGSVNYTENLGVDMYIYPVAIVNHQGKTTLNLTDDVLTITVTGKMNVNSSAAGMNLIDRGAHNSDYIGIVGGKLTYSGTSGVTDTFNAPIWVLNGGSLIVDGGLTYTTSMNLIVKGVAQTTQNSSVYMQDSSSTVQLGGANLEVDNDYRQDSGTLETIGPAACTLKDGASGAGTTSINRGNLLIAQNTYPGQPGQLFMYCGTLNFAGNYGPTIIGDASGQSDLLDVWGTMKIQNTADLTINVYDTLQANNDWTIIKAGAQLQPFNPSYTNEKQLGLTEVVTDDYVLKS